MLKPGGILALFKHNPRNPLTQRIVSNCVFPDNAVLLRSENDEIFDPASRFHRSDPALHFSFNSPPHGLTHSVPLPRVGVPSLRKPKTFIKATA